MSTNTIAQQFPQASHIRAMIKMKEKKAKLREEKKAYSKALRFARWLYNHRKESVTYSAIELRKKFGKNYYMRVLYILGEEGGFYWGANGKGYTISVKPIEYIQNNDPWDNI